MHVGYSTSYDGELRFVRIGDKINRWTIIDGLVIRVAGAAAGKSPRKQLYLRCRCECGTVRDLPITPLLNGESGSCGCLNRERSAAAKTIHGMSRDTLFRKWSGMRQRCENAKHKSYIRYGGRGISVCDEWQEFDVFREWAEASGYAPGLSIERVDVNGNYCPGNCAWIPLVDQSKNRRSTVRATAFGETRRAIDWSKDARCRSSYFALRNRLLAGWDAETAITTPSCTRRRLTPGEVVSIKSDIAKGMTDAKVARMHNLSRTMVRAIRVGKHWAQVKECPVNAEAAQAIAPPTASI